MNKIDQSQGAAPGASSESSVSRKQFSPELGMSYEETRYPTEQEEAYLRAYQRSSRRMKLLLYGAVTALGICAALLIMEGAGDAPSMYLTVGLGLVIALWVLRRLSRIASSRYEKQRLIKVEGEVERGGSYTVSYNLDFLPMLLPAAWEVRMRKHRGEKLTAEGYLSDSGFFYPLEIYELNLSVEEEVQGGNLSV